MARKVEVQIIGDSRSVERAFDRSSKAAQSFNGAVTGALAAPNLKRQAIGMATGYLAVGAAASTALAGIKASVDAASNLNEQISKSQIVFGDSAAALEDWSRTTASGIGVAQDEALAAVGTFGNLFNTVGIGQRVSADMSRSLVQLAADLAAFNNTNPTEALDALRSGLVGEAEPLRRYGVRLSEVRVQQEAMAATGKRNAKALTEQEKALARYRIILTDTVTAQGNFKETQEGFAQQTKILKAEMRDLSAAVGGQLLPALTGVVTAMNDTIGAAKTLGGELGRLRDELPLPDLFPSGSGDRIKDALLAVAPGVNQVRDLRNAAVEAAAAIRKIREEAKEPLKFDMSAVGQLTQGLMTAGLAAKDLIETRGIRTPPPPVVLSAKQRQQFFDARIGRKLERVQDIPSLRGQVAELREVAKQIQARLDATKDITRRLTLEDALRGVMREMASKREDMSKDLLDALSLGVDKALITKTLNDDLAAYQALRAGILAQIKTQTENLDLQRQLIAVNEQIAGVRAEQAEKVLDVLTFGVDKALVTKTFTDDLAAYQALREGIVAQLRTQKGNLDLQRQLLAVEEQIRETRKKQREERRGWLEFGIEKAEATTRGSDDKKAWRAMEKYLLERIRQEGRTLELVSDLWRARQKIKAVADPLAGLMQVSTKKLTQILAAGTGLSAGGRRTLGANISGAQLQPMYIGVNIDGREIGRATSKDQARTGRRTSNQTSGRRSG